MKNAYEKYTKIHAKFVPYLVRNSLHFCSVFLSEMKVLKAQYFEDHPKIDVETYSILRITLKIQFEMSNSLRITHQNTI